MQRTLERPSYYHGVDAGRPNPSSGSANSLPPTPGAVDSEYRSRPRYTDQDIRLREHERDPDSPQAKRDMGRVDARELVRGAKERARYGVGGPLYTYTPQSRDPAPRDMGRRRKRSSSHSSVASSFSIDEMLLETATDRRGRDGGQYIISMRPVFSRLMLHSQRALCKIFLEKLYTHLMPQMVQLVVHTKVHLRIAFHRKWLLYTMPITVRGPMIQRRTQIQQVSPPNRRRARTARFQRGN